jgi:hypothetical protein
MDKTAMMSTYDLVTPQPLMTAILNNGLSASSAAITT